MSRLIYRHVDVKLPHPDGPIRVKGERVNRWKHYEVHPASSFKRVKIYERKILPKSKVFGSRRGKLVKVTDLKEIHEVMAQFHADRKRAS